MLSHPGSFTFILLCCHIETSDHIQCGLSLAHFGEFWICCFLEFFSDFLSIKLSTKGSTESLASGLAFSDAKTQP